MPPQQTSTRDRIEHGADDLDDRVELLQSRELLDAKLRRRMSAKRWRRLGYVAIAVVVAAAVGWGVKALTESDVVRSEGDASNSAPPPIVVEDVVDVRAVIQEHTKDLRQHDYQSLALQWALTVDHSTLDLDKAERQIVQLYALACLYHATHAAENDWTFERYGSSVIPTWKRSSGWLGTRDARDACRTWYGIRCDSRGFVSKIELASNELTGYLPAELGLLGDSLIVLDLYDNYLRNRFDTPHDLEFLSRLSNLRNLYYASNPLDFDGIPSVIGTLTNLVEYDCSTTLHYGKLHHVDWTKLSNLEYLSMERNDYLGDTLPSDLLQLPNLKYFYAQASNITVIQTNSGYEGFSNGRLDFIRSMPAIRELWLDRNPGLHGWLPETFGSTLESFSCSECDLFGPFSGDDNLHWSTRWHESPQLRRLWLHRNQLTGTVSSEFGTALPNLERLHLQENYLLGTVPEEVCDLTSIVDGVHRLADLEMDCHGVDQVRCECCTCCGAACTSKMMETWG